MRRSSRACGICRGALARAGPALVPRLTPLEVFRVSVNRLPDGYEQALTLLRTLSLDP
ncbi:hypothetical protein AB0K48_08830 [Nonomuraea sp. NPDC055795]